MGILLCWQLTTSDYRLTEAAETATHSSPPSSGSKSAADHDRTSAGARHDLHSPRGVVSVLWDILAPDRWVSPMLVEPQFEGEHRIASVPLTASCAEIVHRIIDDEDIMLSLDTETCYNLVEAGMDVWRTFEARLSREQLIEAMACY